MQFVLHHNVLHFSSTAGKKTQNAMFAVGLLVVWKETESTPCRSVKEIKLQR